MIPELRSWVCEFYGADHPVYYGQKNNSKPYMLDGGAVLFVGADWIKKHAEVDPELKRLLVLDSL